VILNGKLKFPERARQQYTEEILCGNRRISLAHYLGKVCSKYGYGAQSILLCGEYYASARGLRCMLSEEELCGRRADW